MLTDALGIKIDDVRNVGRRLGDLTFTTQGTRHMSSDAFREGLERRLWEPHIAPFTQFVDRLRAEGRGNLPYVAPTFGGIHARGLLLFRDPGPATNKSGMLCHQNDDPSAARLTRLLQKTEIDPSLLNSWNAYPWYINRKPTPSEIDAALPALATVLELMGGDRKRVHVYLGGTTSRRAWELFAASYPALVRNVHVYAGRHTSNLGATVKGMTRAQVEDTIMLPVFATMAAGMREEEV